MKKLMRRVLIPTAVVLALAGCAGTPTQFYTLVAPEVAGGAAPSSAFQIEVLPVDVPAQVEVPQIVVRQGTGEMVRVETRRWIAPLDSEIRGALSGALSRDLGVRDVYGLSFGTGIKTWRVALKVQRFDSAPGAYARIDAVWTLRKSGDDNTISTCSSSVSQSVGAGYDALALGHQQAIAVIAAQIAARITALQNGAVSGACPP